MKARRYEMQEAIAGVAAGSGQAAARRYGEGERAAGLKPGLYNGLEKGTGLEPRQYNGQKLAGKSAGHR